MPTIEFKGKQDIYAHHLTVAYRPLVPDADRSVPGDQSDDNLIIHGDNLLALKALIPRYADRIRCIYLDPPYNTGQEGWMYNDGVNSPLMQRWLRENGPVDDEDLERHDKWLAMMWPRLHLLRDLLAESGLLFLSVDDHEQHHLRMLLDEIFGEENFFALLTRRAMHTVRNSSKDFNLNADYVLVYGKNKAWFGEEPERYIRHRLDKAGRYPKDDGDGRGPYKLDPLHARNYYEPYEFTFAGGKRWSPPKGRYPAYSEERLRELEEDRRIDFSGKEPRIKRYLSEVQEGQPPDAVLKPEDVGFNADGTRTLRDVFGEGGVFPQPKPVQLVRFLVELVNDPDAIVLDSFAGSGTTAHAVLSLNREDGGNRRFILVECEDYADKVTAERVRRVIRGVPEAQNAEIREGLGGSFTYCTLGPPLDLERMIQGEDLPEWGDFAAYLLHVASGVSAGASLEPQNEDGLFYRVNGTSYHLLYRPDRDYLESNDPVLNETRARRISASLAKGEDALVFAPGKFISQRELSELGITFCRLPSGIFRMDP